MTIKKNIPPAKTAEWHGGGRNPNLSFAQAMAKAAEERPSAILSVHSEFGEKNAVLAEIHQAGLQLGGAFWEMGLRPGDVIAMQLPNSIENAQMLHAAASIGCIILPIVHILGPTELTQILGDARAKIMVVQDVWRGIDFVGRIDQLGELPDLKHRVIIGQESGNGTTAWGDLPRCDPPAVEVDPDAATLMLYTSGTTAKPKGVLHSARGFLSELFARATDEKELGAWLSPWPSGHVAGTLGMMAHAVYGRPVVVMDAWDADMAAELIERFQVDQTSGTPFHLLGIMDAAEKNGKNLSSLHQFLIGATIVAPELVARSEEAGIRCCRCYGSTEMPTFSQCEPEDPLEKRLNTDGRPNPGCEGRIVDDHGSDVPPGEEGELAVRGPELFLGYTDTSLHDSSFLDGGWFLTGDIARVDKDGFISITDRKKDIIIRGGENISSREVEELLMQMPAIREAAAVAYPDVLMGEKVCAVVILETGFTAPDVAELGTAFREFGVARQKTPERIEVMDAFPRTPTGKVQKAELRTLLGFKKGLGFKKS